jgi:NAD(P)-dependent dehydrogenase (short-subunit alcohol dehydrogenase family)
VTGSLSGKCAIVTGAGQGIGRATAELLARQGATVVVADLDPRTGSETVDAIVGAGGRAHLVETDVSDDESAQRLGAEAFEQTGRIDILVNNAGIGGVRHLPEVDDQYWQRVVDVNLRGVFLASKYALPAMLERQAGCIVNVASVYAFVADPGTSAYAASKGGVVMLTRVMAIDYAPAGIRVNAVCPGFIAGPMADRDHTPEELEAFAERHALGRLGTPDEIAQAILFLVSDASSFVTGSCLLADGGFTAW